MDDAVQTWSLLTAGSWLLQWVTPVAHEALKLSVLGALYFVAESWRPAHSTQRFFKRDFSVEIGYPLFNALVSTPVITLLLGLVLLPLLQLFAAPYALASYAEMLPFGVQLFLALLLIDVAVYVEHRFISHRYLWEFHALHHMTPEVSWLTWARVHPVNGLTIALTSVSLHFIFGFGGAATAAAGTIATSLSIWEHSNMNFAFPKPLCYLLVSPRFHRWHHAREAEAIGKNFCLVFPFLDLLGGSYYCPDRLPHAYGLYVDPAATPEETQASAIPETFSGQMLYPFQRKLDGFQSIRFHRVTPPAAGLGQQAEPAAVEPHR